MSISKRTRMSVVSDSSEFAVRKLTHWLVQRRTSSALPWMAVVPSRSDVFCMSKKLVVQALTRMSMLGQRHGRRRISFSPITTRRKVVLEASRKNSLESASEGRRLEPEPGFCGLPQKAAPIIKTTSFGHVLYTEKARLHTITAIGLHFRL